MTLYQLQKETKGKKYILVRSDSGRKRNGKDLYFLQISTFVNAETRGMTHRIIWCNISKKLERRKLNEKYNELH